MRKRPEIRGRLSSLGASHSVAICPIVRGEILFGIARLAEGRRRQELSELAAEVFAQIPCESVPESAGDAYSQIKRARQRRGLVLDENDLWVAATAKTLGAVLVSSDGDFAQIDGLTVEDWTL